MEGGAVYAYQAVIPAITKTTFSGNSTRGGTFTGTGQRAVGGALCLVQSRAITIADSTFDSNLALGGNSATYFGGFAYGGALWVSQDGVVESIERTIFTGNTAKGGEPSGEADGGALHNRGILGTVDGCAFRDNLALGGDGAANAGNGFGGALSNSGWYGSIYVLRGSSFTGNSAKKGSGPYGSAAGGALQNTGGMIALVESSTFAFNLVHGSSMARGGAVMNVGWLPTFRQNTLAHNVVFAEGGSNGEGGGFANVNFAALAGNLIADNLVFDTTGLRGDDCHEDWPVSLISHGYNLVREPQSCVFAALGDQTAVSPGLGSLGDHGCANLLPDGGCVATILLDSSSPAVDRGNCTPSVAVDERGVARPQDLKTAPNAADACDIGALELLPGEVP